MTQKTPASGVLRSPPRPEPPLDPKVDTADIPDSHPDARLGTLHDAIDRAKARQLARRVQPTGLKS